METLTDLQLVRAAHLVPCVRAAAPDAAAAAEDDGSLGLLEVRFSPFDTWYEIDSWWEGTFLERTSPGAFAKTMRERRDQIVSLFNHGMDFNIGDKVLGPIEDLFEDRDAAVGLVRLMDTSYGRDLLPGLTAGVYRSSFMFNVIREEWDDEPGVSDHNPKGLPERTVKEVRLFEFGPVTFPANPAASSGMRSMTDEYLEHVKRVTPGRYDQLRARATRLRTPDEAGAAPGTPAPEGVARNTDPAPATGHSAVETQAAAYRAARLTSIKEHLS